MDFHAIINLVGTGFIYWAALVGVASVLVHLRVWDRGSTMSTHLLFYMVSVSAVLVLSAIRNLTGDSWWFQLLRLLTFMLVPIAMSQRLWLQVQAQRRREPRSDDEREKENR